ncbi:MAG TPA: hypothetical protein VKZ95_07995, partial [Sphingobacteriaceae bacterium]|nr:hypothetical protein [Sphingobacteriaceae bacterium]
SIHSVRRSDGEVFKVGDMIDQGKIESFRLLGNNEMEVAADTPCSVNLLMLKYATKLKPLFKTEDGVDVYEWDKYWLVNQYFEIITAHTDNNSKHFVLDPNTKARFSTREAAEQWVEDHKPAISKAQLLNAGFSTQAINDILKK